MSEERPVISTIRDDIDLNDQALGLKIAAERLSIVRYVFLVQIEDGIASASQRASLEYADAVLIGWPETDSPEVVELDAAKLEKVVADYNAAVVPGRFNGKALDDCRTEGLVPPKSHWARRIETPPFHAHPLRPGITFTFLSVKVNDQARVMMADGKPSANIFASGEIMSGNILGQGYLAGFGMAIGTVFGRIAGAEAAKLVRN